MSSWKSAATHRSSRRKNTTGRGGCTNFTSLDLRIATILRQRHGRLRGVDAAQRPAEELRGVGGHLLQERLHRIRQPLLDAVLRQVVVDLGLNEHYPRTPLLRTYATIGSGMWDSFAAIGSIMHDGIFKKGSIATSGSGMWNS